MTTNHYNNVVKMTFLLGHLIKSLSHLLIGDLAISLLFSVFNLHGSTFKH